MGHDIKNQSVCFVHTFRADLGQVADASVYIIFDDTFYRGHAFAFHG